MKKKTVPPDGEYDPDNTNQNNQETTNTMKNDTANNGEEKRVEVDVPSTENEVSEVAPTTSPESNNPEANPEITTRENDNIQELSVTCETSDSMPEHVRVSEDMAALPTIRYGTHQLTDEMCQWLSDNREDYEFYLMHAVLHDYTLRNSMLGMPLTPDDFRREEYALVISAITSATKVVNLLGDKVAAPPSPEFLRTYINSAAMEEGSDDETVDQAMQLVKELQNPIYIKEHYCVRPYFEAWYASERAKKAARRIQMENVPDVRAIVEDIQLTLSAASQLDGFMQSRKFDFNNRPEKDEPLLTFKGLPICTPGNIVNLQGPPKSCKSAIVGAILATTLHMHNWVPIDSLGFETNLPPGQVVLHFDTEQSEVDHDRLIRRAYKRAGLEKEAAWLYSYRFTGLDSAMCWSKMLEAVYEAIQKHGGVGIIIIDGVADFCRDPNDSAECFELVRKLHALASDYDCGVITVLHQNPGSQSGKTRGHLGSQIERKAETSLRVEKVKNSEVFHAWADSARSCHIPKAEAWRFHWCDDKKMHVTLPYSDEAWSSEKLGKTKKPSKKEKYRSEVLRAYGEKIAMRSKDLVSELCRVTGLAESTMKSRVREYVGYGFIELKEEQKYKILIS